VPKQAVKVVAAERIGDDGLTIEVTFQVNESHSILVCKHSTGRIEHLPYWFA